MILLYKFLIYILSMNKYRLEFLVYIFQERWAKFWKIVLIFYFSLLCSNLAFLHGIKVSKEPWRLQEIFQHCFWCLFFPTGLLALLKKSLWLIARVTQNWVFLSPVQSLTQWSLWLASYLARYGFILAEQLWRTFLIQSQISEMM